MISLSGMKTSDARAAGIASRLGWRWVREKRRNALPFALYAQYFAAEMDGSIAMQSPGCPKLCGIQPARIPMVWKAVKMESTLQVTRAMHCDAYLSPGTDAARLRRSSGSVNCCEALRSAWGARRSPITPARRCQQNRMGCSRSHTVVRDRPMLACSARLGIRACR